MTEESSIQRGVQSKETGLTGGDNSITSPFEPGNLKDNFITTELSLDTPNQSI